jgi:hypothetical protein
MRSRDLAAARRRIWTRQGSNCKRAPLYVAAVRPERIANERAFIPSELLSASTWRHLDSALPCAGVSSPLAITGRSFV